MDVEDVIKLLAERPRKEKNAAKTVADVVKANLRGCGQDGHGAAETAMMAVVRAVFDVTPLPERIREPFIKAMVTTHMHAHGDLAEGVKYLFSDEFSRSLVLAATIAAVYEQPELLLPEDRQAVNSVPVSTGQYV